MEFSLSQCISEQERYSAKGFVPKPEKNKGAQKQEIWTECIQELSERPHFDRQTKNVLQRIATQSNVPRKKPKFINFLKSSMRYSIPQAEKIWMIIEEGLEEFKKKSAPATSAASAQQPTASASNGNDEPTTSETASDNADTNTTSNGTSVVLSLESIIQHALDQSDTAKTTKKIFKKLQKRSDIPLNVQSPKKKKFVKFLNEQFQLDAETSVIVWECLLKSIEILSTHHANGETIENDGKKRKHTNSTADDEPDDKKQKTEVSLADSTTDANGESTFDWQKHILRIFNKCNTNNQIALNTLKSRVIKKFLKSTGEDDSNSGQYEKKFKKTLKKMSTFAVANGVVELIA